MSYPGLLFVWTMLYITPQFAGPWYDYNFSVYQSVIPLLLILFALPFRRFWWIRSFSAVCLLQIVLNVFDYTDGVPVGAYNNIVTVLNILEFVLLFVIGISTQLKAHYDLYHPRDNTDNGLNDNGSSPRG